MSRPLAPSSFRDPTYKNAGFSRMDSDHADEKMPDFLGWIQITQTKKMPDFPG